MVKAVRVSGYKNSGKTSVLEGLVSELSSRGYEVGTVKHVPHENFSLSQTGTDTFRHLDAGSAETVALGPDKVVTIENKEIDIEDFLLSMMDLDFIIIEGFKEMENIAKIAVARNESEVKKLSDEFTICYIGQGKKELPVLEHEDFPDLADLVEEKAVMPVGNLQCGKCGYDTCREFVLASINGDAPQNGCVALKGPVEMTVDDKQIPLKPFVKDILKNTLSGIVSSLKETEGNKIEIKLDKN